MSLRSVYVYLFLLLGVLVGGVRAFLATPLNLTDPDVNNILCPDQMTDESKDHEWITREAIRRNIRDFFRDYPPSPGFLIDDDATLTEIFHAVYGVNASPARFIKAVNSIATANVKVDSMYQYRFDPTMHGDGEELDTMHTKLVSRYPLITTAIIVDEAYAGARELLGTSLHSIQKFYSHSTWVEQGNMNILEMLGIPGYDIGGLLASDSEDVCTSCASSQGTCSGNVIGSKGLSSGFYTYPTDLGQSQLIPKPPTGGKCSHGGVLDLTARDEAKGGVNKDTTSPCFSPHHYLHFTAAELAVQATDFYLNYIEASVGPVKYRRLYELYQGSALSVSIDTTGSMGDDIDAVKNQVAQIVANTNTEVYVLSEFNDPICGPVLRTSDAQEFLDAVNDLEPYDGGDNPELFWCGLRNALGQTPDYGAVFCFTDADGKDGELMYPDIALAKQQHNKVTVILSDLPVKKGDRGNKGDGEREIITSMNEYKELAEATGGQLINAAKFDVNDIVDIIGSTVETASVTLMQLETDQALGTEVPVDETIVDFELRISGELTSGLFTDPAGKRYDLLDATGLESDPLVDVISHTTTFKALRWHTPSHGVWMLNTTLTAPSHSVSILATSSLDFFADFAFLDTSPPHPHYRPIEGQPLSNTQYYLQVTLIGHIESRVAVVSQVQFVDKAGVIVRVTPYPVDPRDQVYIHTDPLPGHPFFIMLVGYLNSGSKWIRLSAVERKPVQSSVELYATTEDLSARPGESTVAQFVVTNYGVESLFTITATDDLGFLDSVVPDRVFLATNDSSTLQASFTVPYDAKHGLVSTTIITAQSETQIENLNTALAHFVVVSSLIDQLNPTCVLTSAPDCTGYLTNGICQNRNYTASASLRDYDTGLYDVRADPTGLDLTVYGLTPGTTDEVLADYLTSCCSPKVKIMGIDGQGNVGVCDIDLGTVGGLITNFHVNMSGDIWVVLRWEITTSDLPIHHYDIEIDSAPTMQSHCQEESCAEMINYLEPCRTHRFTLTPYFTSSTGTPLPGASAYTQGETLDGGNPDTPINGHEIDASETTITLAWDPANSVCSYEYEVCYYEVNTDPNLAICVTTTTTSVTLRNLEPCKAYLADVVAKSPTTGMTSPPLNFYGVTICIDVPLELL